MSIEIKVRIPDWMIVRERSRGNMVSWYSTVAIDRLGGRSTTVLKKVALYINPNIAVSSFVVYNPSGKLLKEIEKTGFKHIAYVSEEVFLLAFGELESEMYENAIPPLFVERVLQAAMIDYRDVKKYVKALMLSAESPEEVLVIMEEKWGHAQRL